MRGTLYIWPDGVLFEGRDLLATARHRHFPASLIFALDGPFRYRTGTDATWHSGRGVVLAPNVDNQVDGSGHRLAVLLVDPESQSWGRLRHLVDDGPVTELPSAVVDTLAARATAVLGEPGFAPARLWDAVFALVGRPEPAEARHDTRVVRVLEHLKAHFLEKPPVRVLAKAGGLSGWRLVRVFKQQMGLSLRRYVLWLRVRHVFFMLALGHNLTAAAHEAGFADAAHLSRTFRHMFGLAPSTLVHGSVQVVFAPPTMALDGPHAPQDAMRWAMAVPVLRDRRPDGRRITLLEP